LGSASSDEINGKAIFCDIKKRNGLETKIGFTFNIGEFQVVTRSQLTKYKDYSMTINDDDDNVININFDTKNNKGTKPTEKERFADTLDAAKVEMVRGIIVGEDKNGDIKLITSIEDLEQCSLLIDEAKSFLEGHYEA
jgi:hypothetical protein